MSGRIHSPEFKLDILRQVEVGGKSKAQLCREHDLSPTLVHRWQQQYEQHGEAAFDKALPVDETQALERRVAELERLLGQSTAENAFLKNALAASLFAPRGGPALRVMAVGASLFLLTSKKDRRAMIASSDEAGLSVRRQCELLGLNRSSTQYVRKKTQEGDKKLQGEIENIVLEQPGDGYRRVTHELRRRQQLVNHKRVRRVMRVHGLQCRVRPRRKPTLGLPATGIPNVLRDERIVPTAPNQVWHADFTCVHILTGFVYLACVLDGYSRKIVGWALSKRADAKLVCDALGMALRTRGDVVGLVHHSDQGSQDQSAAYLAMLDAAEIRKSMSRKGTPGDHAKMERCIRNVKVEEVYLNCYENEQDARRNLKRFLEDVYNQKRLHSSLDYRPPDEFEAVYAQQHNLPCPLA